MPAVNLEPFLPDVQCREMDIWRELFPFFDIAVQKRWSYVTAMWMDPACLAALAQMRA